MLPALLDDQRHSLRRISLMLCTFAIAALSVTTSITSIASARDHTSHGMSAPTQTETLVYPHTDLRRDPFVPEAGYHIAAQGASAAVAGAGSAIVRAVITGAEPRALVELNGSVRVVGIGDRIGTLAVIGITRGGIIVDGGLTLPLVEGQP